MTSDLWFALPSRTAQTIVFSPSLRGGTRPSPHARSPLTPEAWCPGRAGDGPAVPTARFAAGVPRRLQASRASRAPGSWRPPEEPCPVPEGRQDVVFARPGSSPGSGPTGDFR